MVKYESVFILKPTLDEENINANVEKFKDVILNSGGQVENVDLWGKRKLAYEIKKFNEGIYVLINFMGEPDLSKELDRNFRITESVIRHLIIRLED